MTWYHEERIQIDEEFLRRIKGLYSEHVPIPYKEDIGSFASWKHARYIGGGCFYSRKKVGKRRVIWCFWDSPSEVWKEGGDDEAMIATPLDHGYVDTWRSAEDALVKTIQENRPDWWKPYIVQITGDSVGHREIILKRTRDDTDHGEAAEAYHKKLVAQKKARRKKRIAGHDMMTFAYFHYTEGHYDYFRKLSKRAQRNMNTKVRWDWNSKKKPRHKTLRYRIKKRTALGIFIEREPFDATRLAKGDWRDYQARHYVFSRHDFETRGFARHGTIRGRGGILFESAIHPQFEVPTDPEAVTQEPCFVFLADYGLKFPCKVSDITKLLRQLSKQYHPDKVQGEKEKQEAAVRFMEIHEHVEDARVHCKAYWKSQREEGRDEA